MTNHMINNSFTTIYTSSTNRNARYNQYKCIVVIHALNLTYRMLVFPIVKIVQSDRSKMRFLKGVKILVNFTKICSALSADCIDQL